MKLKWKTRDGTKVWIRDMTDGHLMNALKLVIRVKAKQLLGLKIFYLTCPSPSGDMATECFEEEQEHWLECGLHEYLEDDDDYAALNAARDRRGLIDLDWYIDDYSSMIDRFNERIRSLNTPRSGSAGAGGGGGRRLVAR